MDDWAVVMIPWLGDKPPPPPCRTAFPHTLGVNCINFIGFATSPSVLRSLHALGTLLALEQVYRQPWREPTAFPGGFTPQ